MYVFYFLFYFFLKLNLSQLSVQILMSSAYIQVVTFFVYLVTYFAVSLSFSLLQTMLQHESVNVNACDNLGNTPLHYCAVKDSFNCVNVLVSKLNYALFNNIISIYPYLPNPLRSGRIWHKVNF